MRLEQISESAQRLGSLHLVSSGIRARAWLAAGALWAVLAASGVAAAGDGLTSRLSVGTGGVQSDQSSGPGSISADGRFAVFTSQSELLGGPTNAYWDVFLHDRLRGTTEQISIGIGAAASDGDSGFSSISPDGRLVVFSSYATNLVVGDVNSAIDVFVHDRANGTTRLVSRSSTGAQGDAGSSAPAISANGRWVVFHSFATNLVPFDQNGLRDVFVRDIVLGTTQLVSRSSGGQQGNQHSLYGSLSANGRFVAFASDATNLVAGDTNGARDVFVHDRRNGLTQRVSVGIGGAEAQGVSYCSPRSISDDGRFVVFASYAALTPGDTNGAPDVFVRDRLAAVTELVSMDPTGAPANGPSQYPGISADGAHVVFLSLASNLAPGDADCLQDLFVHDRASGTTELVNVDSQGLKIASSAGLVLGTRHHVSSGGERILFSSRDAGLVPDDTNAMSDVFLRDRAACPQPARFCPAKRNSLGCVPTIVSSGSPSLSGPDDLQVAALQVRNQEIGLLLWSTQGQFIPFGPGGAMCIVAPAIAAVGGAGGSPAPAADCTGGYRFRISHAFLDANSLGAGDVLYVQYLSRDGGFSSGSAVGLTQGLQVQICP